jgi:hypothetical protein
MQRWLISLRGAGANFAPPEAGGDGLFFVQGTPLVDQAHVTCVIKAVARDLSLDPVAYSCHSLRYGGVCMLASSGVPRYLIEYHGGWSKDSTALSEVYLHVSNTRDEYEVANVLSSWESGNDLSGARLRHTLSRR